MKISNFKFQISSFVSLRAAAKQSRGDLRPGGGLPRRSLRSLLAMTTGLQKGFSILEVILAAAIFVTFATAAVVVVISGIDNNRLGGEMTVANQFNAEGIEAVRSIKNQSWTTFISKADAGNTGVTNGSGTWAFNGANNIFASDTRFIRTININSVQRDGSGNIVTSGINDPNTKKVTVRTTWNFTSARPESVEFTDYLTNWTAGVIDDGIMVYGDTTAVAQPKFRIYSDSVNTFSIESVTDLSLSETSAGKNFEVQTSPIKVEAVVGYVNNSGQLRVMCFDGNSWNSPWTANVGGNGTSDHRFAIGYEKTTGDVMVAYSRGSSGTNAVDYKVKSGTTDCSGAWNSGSLPTTSTLTTGIVRWIRLESSSVNNSNNLAIAWNDSNSRLGAAFWNGSSWSSLPGAALETNLERVSTAGDVQSFDLAFENTSGNVMVVWGLFQSATCTAGTTIATTNCIRYARYTTSWSAIAVVPTVADPATNIDIAANPTSGSNQLVFGALDNTQGDVSLGFWSGSAWTGRANQDTSAHCVGAGEKLVATGWLYVGATARSVVVYHDSTNNTCTNSRNDVRYFTGNGSTFTARSFTPSPLFAVPQRWYAVQSDPKHTDRLMLTLSDNAADLFAKRLVMNSTGSTFTWSNSDDPDGGGPLTGPLELNLGQTTSKPFGFSYWRNP